MKIPPGMLRSRSFTRFTMRVGLPHLGQLVLLDVSITFLRSAVFAILAIIYLLTPSPGGNLPRVAVSLVFVIRNSESEYRLVTRQRQNALAKFVIHIRR